MYNVRMIEIGQKIKVSVEKLTMGGAGIARSDGFVVFVPYSASGDELEVEITDRRKTFARARILRVLKSSPQRVVPPCAHYFTPASSPVVPPPTRRCGFQHLYL